MIRLNEVRTEHHTHYRGDEKVTVTESHTNPGGRDGLNGHTGSFPMFSPAKGENGESGSLEIYIQNEKSSISGPYGTSYQLEIVHFDIADDNEDGIHEFGENITVKNIYVENKGQ